MIIFQNDGEIDVNAIKTLGVSVKEDGAIGFFGTGLKFAIAVLLRNKQRLTIWSGETKLEFGTQELYIRGRRFDMVTLNGEPINFTTELGKTWEMWMAFRELYCNCKDEGGSAWCGPEVGDIDNPYAPITQRGITVVVVEGDLFRAEYFNRGESFIEGTPVFADHTIEAFDRPSKHVYYRGVRIYTPPNPCVMTYNLLGQLDLTEDRTVKYSWNVPGPISRGVMQLTDETQLWKVICAPLGSYERGNLEFTHDAWSPEFERIALREYKADSLKTNASVFKFVHKLNLSNLHPPIKLTAVQEMQLERALIFVKKLGYDPHEYDLKIVETLGSCILAQAIHPSRQIILSRALFGKGTKYVALALIEETIHLREGLSDETRGLQTYLLEKIVSLGEELQGQPL